MIYEFPFVKYVEIQEVTDSKDLEKRFNGKNVQVFEKIDGGLCQVRKIQGKLFPGSKANFLKGFNTSKSSWKSNFVSWMYSNPTLYNLDERLLLFGEWCGHHTISYDSQNTDQFYLIDIFDLASRRFINYHHNSDIALGLGLKDVRLCPILHSGEITKKTIDQLMEEPSALYPGQKEGLVIKDYDSQKQVFYKLLSDGFEEQRSKLFGRTEVFTDSRIRKSMLRLRDEFGVIGFSSLVNEVLKDIKKETGRSYDLSYGVKRVVAYVNRIKNEAELLKYLRD